MEILLLRDNEITENTILGGNIDVDKYKFCIQDAQLSVLIETLGEDLYEKICTDFENDNLTDKYLTLYDKYINPFLIRQSAVEYLKIASFTVANGGVFKMTPQNGQSVESSDIDNLVTNYKHKADIYLSRLEKYLCKENFPEWKSDSENIVNPTYPKLNSFSFLGEQKIYREWHNNL